MSETVLDREAPEAAADTPHDSPHDSTDGRYLTFTLGEEVYALDIVKITEIIEFRALTVVPMMPPFVRGVINLRGRVLPVIDLKTRFGQGSTEVARRTVVLVVETEVLTGSGGSFVGLIVDAVNKVVHLGPDDIEAAPAFGAGIRADFIGGMAKLDDDFVVVLDIDQVLRIEDVLLGDALGTRVDEDDLHALP